ncbi:MAG: tyrosine recombinase XerC [Gallionellaceae bacterium]|jgi:integrase/recombinase XerC
MNEVGGQLSTPLQGYLAYLNNERHYSPLTAENYARDIRRLLALAGETPLTGLKSHHIRRYIAQLHGSGLSGRSLARVLSAWRGFYAYLMRDHACPVNPCMGLRAPKSPKNLPHALSPDEAVKLVNADAATPVEMRDKAMFELLYSSGLRLAELVDLDPVDMDFLDASVRVTGKGSKTRIVPLGSHAITALQAWLKVRSQLAKPDEPALFVGKNGARIAHRTVQLQLRNWGIKQGISSGVHPHLLRHSFATHVLQSSGDLRAVQEMLGHASISSTQVYTHLDFQYLSKIYDGAHPRAKKKTP